MKKYFFFPVFTLFLGLMLLVGCDRSDQPVPEEVPGTSTQVPTDGDIDLDGSVSFRACGSTDECDVLVSVVSGNGFFNVCGANNGSTACTAVTNCGTSNGFLLVYQAVTSSGSVCITPGEVFTITNTDTTDLRVTVSTSAGSTPTIIIGAGNTVEIEVGTDCFPSQC